jgi:hypothetical protein
MIFEPLTAQSPKPWALLVPGWHTLRVFTLDGVTETRGPERCYQRLGELSGHVNYVAGSLRSMLFVVGATHWTADVWKGKATTLILDGSGTRVTSLKNTLGHLSDPLDQFTALTRVLEFLSHQGVRAGSLSSMAAALWRSTLPREIEFAFDARVGRSGFYGGRQERPDASADEFTDQVSLDISSAYPTSQVERPYATGLRGVDKSTTLDPTVAGLCEARVHVPEDLRFAPLPVRLGPNAIQWARGDLEGVWTWCELDAAMQVGAIVTPVRVWAPTGETSPFDAWWTLCRWARDAVGEDAAKLVKAITNMLWSTFALVDDGRSATVRWRDDHGDEPTSVRRPRRRMPQANTVHVSAETSSRVRRRMLLEGLYGDTETPSHCDTDGIICSLESAMRRTRGHGAGEWRFKNEMRTLQIKAPQLYRYTCGPYCGVDHSQWHYVASGIPGRFASELFERHPGFQVSMRGDDQVLPSGSLLEGEQLARYLEAATDVQRSAWGPSLV